MVKLNPSEAQLLAEALFDTASPAELEDLQALEFENDKNEVGIPVPESKVQFPIRRRRSSVYRKLFCIGLFLVLLCAGLIIATYLLKTNDYIIEIKLTEGQLLTYRLEQEMSFEGLTNNKTSFSEYISLQVVNKTDNGHWLRFKMGSLPKFGKKNLTFLVLVDLDGQKVRLGVGDGKERYEIYTGFSRNEDFDFYVHNLFNQLLPVVKIDLFEVILSQMTTRTKEIPMKEAWFLPGKANMQQSISTQRDKIIVSTKINPENFEGFAEGVSKMKLNVEENAVISKQNGLVITSDMTLSATIPIEGTFEPRATIGVKFTSLIRLTGDSTDASYASDYITEEDGSSYLKIPKPSSLLSPRLKYIPPSEKTVAKENSDLVREIKELFNIMITKDVRKNKAQALVQEIIQSDFYKTLKPQDGTGFAEVDSPLGYMGPTKSQQQSHEGPEGPSVEIGDWKTDYGKDGYLDRDPNELDPEIIRDDKESSDDMDESPNREEEDTGMETKHEDSQANGKLTDTEGKTENDKHIETKKKTEDNLSKSNGTDTQEKPHHQRNYGSDESSTKDTKNRSKNESTTQKTTAEEKDISQTEWNPFKIFDDLRHSFDNDDTEEDNDDDNFKISSMFPFKLPSFPFFKFPDMRKRRSLEPEKDEPATSHLPRHQKHRRDKRRLTEDGQERIKNTRFTANDLDMIWDVVSDTVATIHQRPRKTITVFQETILGVEVVGDLEHEVEVVRKGDDLEERNAWKIRFTLGVSVGQHRFKVLNKEYSLNEIEEIFLRHKTPKMEYGTVHGGTMVICTRLFYIQHVCVEIRLHFSLHFSHTINKLTKEFPVEFSVHFKHVAKVNAILSSYASTLLNGGGVYGKGALVEARIPLELRFTETKKPEWCSKANLKNKIGSFYRMWSDMTQWSCPLDDARTLGANCTGLDERAQHSLGKLTSRNSYTKKLHFLNSC